MNNISQNLVDTQNCEDDDSSMNTLRKQESKYNLVHTLKNIYLLNYFTIN